jgi:hypothetical protein
MTVSVVVVTYRRLAHLGEILEAWLKETPDVWLCDCSKDGYKCSLPVNIVHARPDPGNRIRHAVATLTSGDMVFKADDDIVPLPGLVDQFRRAFDQYGDAIYGIHGRKFLGPRYYAQTRMWGPGNTKVITPVDFVGVITCAPRKYLAMDLRGCGSEVEDLYWQMAGFPSVKKFVVPAAGLVKHLPESFDKGRLCGTKESRVIRQRFYQAWYEKNYAGRTR